MSPAIALTIAFLLVLLNGFFVAAEFALVKVRSTRISELANEGRPTAVMMPPAKPARSTRLYSGCNVA